MAEEAKAKGNEAFSSDNFKEAIKFFSEAIDLTPSNHVLYSNRSDCHASLNQYDKALEDAKVTVKLKSDWAKGYICLGAAYVALGSLEGAISSYKKGLEFDPSHEGLKSGLVDAQAAAIRSSAFGKLFQGKETWNKLEADPTTNRYLQQPDFVRMIMDLRRIPSSFILYLKDHKMLDALGVLLNVPTMGVEGEDKMTEEVKERKARAEKKYEDCIKYCDKFVERGRELRVDFKIISRALTQKGTAFAKMAKTSKAYEPAIEAFKKALTEHRNPDTLKKLNDAEKAKEDLEQQEYFDPKLADEEYEKGKEFFKQKKYPEAVKHYTEALRRNPKDPKVYFNRAVCYTNLMTFPEGLKDAKKCLELDPTFTNGYTRKGTIQFIMKEYDKAMETYQEGLKYDPGNQDLQDGIPRCKEQKRKEIEEQNRKEIEELIL